MASLDCRGTPISIPQGFDLSGIPVDKATRLRLIAPKLPPTGPVAALPDGLNLNENNQIELHLSDSRKSASGYRYSLIDSRLTFPAIHNLTGGLPRAELCLYFRNQALNLTSKIVCICLGLAIGMDDQAPYFTALSTSTLMPQRPPLTSLFESDDTFIEYVGADLRGRTLTTPNPSSKCDPVLQKVTYFVCVGQGVIGSQATLTRLIGLAGTGLIGPVKQTIKTLPSDLVKYASLVYGIRLGQGGEASGTAGTPTPTSALKCYRIDPSKDIKNGTITLGEPSDGTLADEVVASQISQNAALPAGATSGFQPGDAETYIAITVAVILGICLVLYLLHQFYPGGLGGFAGNTAAAAGVAGSALASGARTAGTAVAGGAVVAGSALASGARATGSALASGAGVAGSAIASGASATGSAIASGASAVGSAAAGGILAASSSVGRMRRGPIPFSTSGAGAPTSILPELSTSGSAAGTAGSAPETATTTAGSAAGPSGSAGGSGGSWFGIRRRSPFTPPSPPGAPGLTRPSGPDELAEPPTELSIENANRLHNPFHGSKQPLTPAPNPPISGGAPIVTSGSATPAPSSTAPVVTSSSAAPATSSKPDGGGFLSYLFGTSKSPPAPQSPSVASSTVRYDERQKQDDRLLLDFVRTLPEESLSSSDKATAIRELTDKINTSTVVSTNSPVLQTARQLYRTQPVARAGGVRPNTTSFNLDVSQAPTVTPPPSSAPTLQVPSSSATAAPGGGSKGSWFSSLFGRSGSPTVNPPPTESSHIPYDEDYRKTDRELLDEIEKSYANPTQSLSVDESAERHAARQELRKRLADQTLQELPNNSPELKKQRGIFQRQSLPTIGSSSAITPQQMAAFQLQSAANDAERNRLAADSAAVAKRTGLSVEYFTASPARKREILGIEIAELEAQKVGASKETVAMKQKLIDKKRIQLQKIRG